MSTDDRPRWTPTGATTQSACRNCGEPVLAGTARVFGDQDDTLWHCGACDGYSLRDLKQGAGADPDYDPDVDRGETSENLPVFGGEHS